MNISAELDPASSLTDIPGGVGLLNAFALRGGKKFRPKLLLAVADALGVPQSLATPYAIAAERIHNATLLHDDVIDESSWRRGKPTLNAGGKNRQAVLAGDLLLAETLRDLAQTGNLAALHSIFDVLVELSEGEWLQLEARGQIEVTERHLIEVASKKTGSLIAWCCATPALLTQSPSAWASILRRIGYHLGVAFQMLDDCADFDHDSGKPFAQDLREGQVNLVVYDVLQRHPNLKSKLFDMATIENLRKDFDSLLSPSLLQTIERAELEITSASALLHRPDFVESASKPVETEILQPFLKQIQAYREKWS